MQKSPKQVLRPSASSEQACSSARLQSAGSSRGARAAQEAAVRNLNRTAAFLYSGFNPIRGGVIFCPEIGINESQ